MRKTIVALTGLLLLATAIPGSALMGLTETELLEPVPTLGLLGNEAGCDLRLTGGSFGYAYTGTPMLEPCNTFDVDQIVHDWDITHAAVACPATSPWDCWTYAFPWSYAGPWGYIYIVCTPGSGGVYTVPSGDLVFGVGGCTVVQIGDTSGWISWYGYTSGSADAPPSFSFADNEADALVHGLLFAVPLPSAGGVSALSAGCDLRDSGAGFGYAHTLAPEGPCPGFASHEWTITHAAVNCPSNSPFTCWTYAFAYVAQNWGYFYLNCPPGAGGVYEIPSGNLVHGPGGCGAFQVGGGQDGWESWYGYTSGSAAAAPSFAFTELELLAVLHYDSWQ